MRLVVLWPQRDCPCLWHVYMIKKLAQKNTEGVGKGGLKSEAETKNKRSARLFLLRFLAKNDFWKWAEHRMRMRMRITGWDM